MFMSPSNRATALLTLALLILAPSAGHSEPFGASLVPTPAPPAPELKLWYRQPAGQWLEALPVGNGRLGAVIYGGVPTERIALDETTLWSGGPTDGQYNPQGGAATLARIRALMLSGSNDEAWKMTIATLENRRDNFGTNMPGGETQIEQQGATGPVTRYLRQLDLDNAVATTSFTANGIHFTRETIASHPANILATKFTADAGASIAFHLTYNPGTLPCTIRAQGDDTLIVTGHAYGPHAKPHSGVAFQITFRVIATHGAVSASDTGLTVTGADSALLLVAFNTDFRGRDPAALCDAQIASASFRSWDQLRSAHVADYQSLFRRVSLNLGGQAAAAQPTDIRRDAISPAHPDPQLQALFFQYGRYLLIAGSRADSPLPTHLQGIWNDNGAANMAWSCDYHININTEQNYWPTETCNLSECGEPLFHLVEGLTVPGHQMVQAMFGIDEGWACFWSTNAWGSIPSGEDGYGFEIVGGVWIATHLWDHYAFTGDRRFLATRAYPVLKGASEFFLAYLFPDPKSGYLLSGPSGSPERGFDGPSPTHDTALITALFQDVIAGGEILGIDAPFRARVQAALDKLPPYKIGRNGQIQEWLFDDDGGDTNHRHTSHLVGLFPLGAITPLRTPALAAAAAKSLSLRMDRDNFEDVEWSRANAICYQARLRQGDKAEASLLVLIHKLSRADLLTVSVSGVAGASQDIFCVDGNEAGTAGMAEMLLQSQDATLDLLPSVPATDWPDGSVTGLCARGGYEVSMKWRAHKLDKAVIHSTWGGPINVRYGLTGAALDIHPGETKTLNADLQQIPN